MSAKTLQSAKTLHVLTTANTTVFYLHILCPFLCPISQFVPPVSEKPTCQV
jgi:hypothetical protein